MRIFSYEEIDELGEGLIRQYLGKEAERTCCVDIEGFVTDFLKLPLLYRSFAEEDSDTERDYQRIAHHRPERRQRKHIPEVLQSHPRRIFERLERREVLKRHHKPEHWAVGKHKREQNARYQHQIKRELPPKDSLIFG